MKKIFVCLSAFAALCIASSACAHQQAQASSQPSATAQAGIDQDIKLLRQDIQSGRKQIVAANLKLTDDQATKFWPVYEQYAAELVKIGDQKTQLLKEYSDEWGRMTDEQGSNLLKRSLALDQQVAQLRVKYAPIFEKAVPGNVVATFFQIDRRIQSLIDIQLQSQIPLVQSQD